MRLPVTLQEITPEWLMRFYREVQPRIDMLSGACYAGGI